MVKADTVSSVELLTHMTHHV